MAGTILNDYGTSGQPITITLASLATGSQRQGTAIDNSTNLFEDSLVMVGIKTGASGTSTTGYVDVYAAGTVDGGTTYSGGATGSDAAYTGQLYPSLAKLGRIPAIANATVYYGGPWSVAMAFGGTLPQKWTIVVDNESGAALDATEGNHYKKYQGNYGSYT